MATSFCHSRKLVWVMLLVAACLLAHAQANGGRQRRKIVRCGEQSNHQSSRRACRGVFLCPEECPRTCYVDCSLCKPVCTCNRPGAVCQDPRFVGGDGLTFYFHGHKDQHFCLVSDPNLHINSYFIGKRNPRSKREFTWVQSIGLMFDNHKLLISAQKTPSWDKNIDRLAIAFDGEPVSLPTKTGSKWDPQTLPQVAISRTSDTNGVVVEVAQNVKIAANVVPITAEESRVHRYGITDEDCFAHLELSFKFYNLSDTVDGVLGQTYRSNYKSRVKMNVDMPVMGGANKYRTSGIFRTDCPVSRFGKLSKDRGTVVQKMGFEGVKCTSGMQGRGLVCKR